MNWIKIEDREPKNGQLVLVKGTRIRRHVAEPIMYQIGLVEYDDSNYSESKEDRDIFYSNITEWGKVE